VSKAFGRQFRENPYFWVTRKILRGFDPTEDVRQWWLKGMLSQYDLYNLIPHIALKRHTINRAQNRQTLGLTVDGQGVPREQVEMLGASGEVAVARWLGDHPQYVKDSPEQGADIHFRRYGFDVKATWRGNGSLLVPQDRIERARGDTHGYILVIGNPYAGFYIVGWAWAAEVEAAPYRPYQKRCHGLSQHALRSPASLLRIKWNGAA